MARLQHYSSLGCCAIWTAVQLPYNGNILSLGALKGQLESYTSEAINAGKSILICTINTNQSDCEPILKKAGFKCSHKDWAYRDFSKSQYRTGVKVYVKHLIKPVKEKKEGEVK